jgi:tetratricopeptide (TPR) repeat protein
VHRNLALVYFNKQRNPTKALRALEKAFALDPTDARVLFELDLLKKRAQIAPEKRFAFLQKHWPAVQEREDLLLEFITLLNVFGEHEVALNLLRGRKFHPWEGGEGKVTGQYVLSLMEMAKRLLAGAAVKDPDHSALRTPHSAFERALELLGAARSYPENLGEGKLHGAQENQVLYWLGVAYSRLGDDLSARRCWEEASRGMKTPTPAVYYNDQNPETIFYQGLALQQLGRSAASRQRFRTLVKFGKEHLRDRVVIDYFAVSLPEFMVFDDDLDRRNQINCRYLMALGYLGLGKTAQARKGLQLVLELDPAHLPARLHLQQLCNSFGGVPATNSSAARRESSGLAREKLV